MSTLFADPIAPTYRKSKLKLPADVEVLMSNTLQEVKCSYKPDASIKLRRTLNNSRMIVEDLRRIWDNDKLEYVEEFIILMLNRANKIMGWVKIGIGGQAGVVCDPKIIFQHALLSNATSIVLCHNHPSGTTRPSQADISLTNKIKSAGAFLDIAVLDHIILTADSFFSFNDEGMI